MNKIYLMIIAVSTFITVNAKTPKADQLFERWEYFRAAKLYEKEAAKNPSADVYFKLGECYRKMNCYKKEEQAAYDKVNAAGTYINHEFYLNYGHVLRYNGKYSEAKAAYTKYSELIPTDTLGKFFSEAIDIVTVDHLEDEPILVSNVSILNTSNADFSLVQYKDDFVYATTRKTSGRSKIYGWTGSNYSDIYFAKKGSDDTSFTNIVPFEGKHINTKYHDGPVCFSTNFDTIFISRVSKELSGLQKKTLSIERNKIYVSVLKDNEWSKVIPFHLNSDSFSVANPFLTKDGSRIYFVSDMPGGLGETDIYYCTREGNNWSAPVNMGPTVNTFNREKFPAIDSEGNFFFSSNGYQGFGGMDICVALNNNGSFVKAKPLKYPFNSYADDYGIAFLKDEKTGYISSNRFDRGKGDDDIFYFDMVQIGVDTNLIVSDYTIGRKRLKPIKPDLITTVEEKTTARDNVVLIPVLKITSVIPPSDKSIYFDFDKASLDPSSFKHLDSIVDYMKSSSSVLLVLGGHCDSHGTKEYNIILSNQRYESVIRYLKSKGVERKRMEATGYGFSQLVNDCEKGVVCTDAEDQLNRRVEFHFEEPIAVISK